MKHSMKSKVRVGLLALVFWLVPFLASSVAADSATAATGKTSGVEWRSYDQGLEQSKAAKKKIFLNFYADWCHYCTMMKEKTFSQPQIREYLNDNYVPVRVNSDKNPRLAQMYGVRGLPISIFLDENGKNIGNQPGFIPPEKMLPLLKYVHTDSYKKMSYKSFAEGQ